MGLFKKTCLFLISITLFTLSIPPFHWNIFGWVAFVPFYIVILRSKQRLLDGLLYGVIFGFILYGITYVGIYKSQNIRIFGTTAIILFQGIFYASHAYCIGLILKLVKKKNIQYPLILYNWLVLEFVGNKLFYGFSMYGAMSQYKNYTLLYLAQFIGIYGVSLIVLMANLLITHVYLTIREQRSSSKSVHKAVVMIACIVLLIMSCEVNNRWVAQQPIESQEQIRVALIQGNVSDLDYKKASVDFSYSEQIFLKYLQLSKDSLQTVHSDLIIWPETAVHRYMMRLPEYRDQLLDFARDNQVALLIGSQDLSEAGDQYNSVFLISSKGELIGKYDKTRLFPFTEKAFTAANSLPNVLEWQGFKLGLNICFESNFPEHSAQLVKQGADLLCVLSNNGAFGFTRIPFFTSVFSVFRAVENRKYLIQVMNTGISQIITPVGTVLERTKLFTTETVYGQLPLEHSNPTFYSLYGAFVYWSLTILFIITIIILYLRDRQMRLGK